MLKRIEDYLRSNYINVPNEWIPACIEFIKEEHGNSNIGNYIWLKEKVFEQWLHADLTELGTCCLPLNLSNERCATIKGQFVLQVNHIKDIGLPAYSQLQKLRKDDVDNASVSAEKVHTAVWEPKPSRMLLLQLTDGTKVIQGMEYRSINQLSLAMKPGTKILIKGIIESRRGILLLTKDHVTVLGGEVESLVVPNAPENILRRTLRLEESENPISIPEAFSSTCDISQTQSQYYNTQSTQNSSFPSTFNKPKAFVNPSCNLPTTNACQFDDDFEDFMDVETEMALLEAEQMASSNFPSRSQSQPLERGNLESSNNFVSQVASFPSTSSSQNSFLGNVNKTNFGTQASCGRNFEDNFFDDDDDDDLLMAAAEVNASTSSSSSTFQRNSISSAKINPFSNSTVKNTSFPISSNKVTFTRTEFTNNTNEALTKQQSEINNSLKLASKPQEKNEFSSTNQIINSSINSPSNALGKSSRGNLRQTKLSSFIFEKKIRNEENTSKNILLEKQDIKSILGSNPPYQYIYFMNLHPHEKVTYTIKGFVATLLSKLEHNNGKWSLGAKINDGSGSCDVDIDDQVLQNLMGMSVQEFQEQKQQAIDNPQLRATLGQRVCKCQMELIRMCRLLQVEVSPDASRPRVTKLIELTDQDLQLLKERSNRLNTI